MSFPRPPIDVSVALGRQLYELRRRAKLTQEQVAQAAEISEFQYRTIESGLARKRPPQQAANPTLGTLLAILGVLGDEGCSLRFEVNFDASRIVATYEGEHGTDGRP